MALNNYAALQASVADWLNRTDLTTQIIDFILLAETKIERRVRRKTIRTTITVAAESTALPADCAELRSAYPITGQPTLDGPLSLASPEMLADIKATHAAIAGRPAAVAVVDGNLIVAPPPDQTYTLQVTYFQKLVPLATSGSTNTIFTEAPDIYLYGALVEGETYLDHDERITTWQARFDDAVDSLNQVRQAEETNMSLKAARLPVVF